MTRPLTKKDKDGNLYIRPPEIEKAIDAASTGSDFLVYSDALNRLADRLHYLNRAGDKAQDSTRFWFDTRANLRREMEDRKRRFDEKEVREKIADSLKHRAANGTFFDGVHIFTPHGDVPDDSVLRLVVFPPDRWYSREEGRLATEAALEWIRNNGPKPRHRWNRLLFLAGDPPGKRGTWNTFRPRQVNHFHPDT